MSRKQYNKQKATNKTSMSVVSLSNYEQPYATENYGTEWVTFDKARDLGTNSYFDYIVDCYNGSTTNKTLVDRITDEVYGKGLRAIDIEDDSDEWKNVIDHLPEQDLYNLDKDIKLWGQGALQISWSGTGKERKWTLASHIAVDKIAKNKRDKDGNIMFYWYCFDWADKHLYEPKKYPAFGTSKEKIEILYFDSYEPGKNYYANPDYNPSLQSSETEEEISNFDLNTVKTGFSPNVMIQYNNGQPDDKVAHEIKSNVQREFTGSGGAKMIIGFNDTAEQAATITDIPVPNAHEQYTSLTERVRDKILMSHKVVSPILYGIKDNTGFGNNADELETAFQLNRSTVIRPIQEKIIRHLDKLFKANGWEYDLYFEPLVPIEFMTQEDVEEVDIAEEVEKEEVDTELSAEFEVTEISTILDFFAQDAPEGYEFYKTEACIDEDEDFDYGEYLNELHLVGAVTSKPTTSSRLDSPMYKVRYTYEKTAHTPSKGGQSREFCRKVVSLRDQKRYFRKEDIGFMSTRGVNRSFGHNGQNYSIWDWKGGSWCRHSWQRVIFKKKLQENGKPYIGNPLQNVTTVKSAPGVEPIGKEAIAPVDTEGNGRYPGTY